jgi:hypothetical protein
MTKFDNPYEHCAHCVLSLSCLAGRYPAADFRCDGCGALNIIIEVPYVDEYGNYHLDRTKRTRGYIPCSNDAIVPRYEPRERSPRLCRSCYLKRETEVDADPDSWAMHPRGGSGMWGR